MQGETGVTAKIEGFEGARHHADEDGLVGELDLDPADARGTVTPKGRYRRVLSDGEAPAHNVGKVAVHKLYRRLLTLLASDAEAGATRCRP